jgi:general secretion pathway protein H
MQPVTIARQVGYTLIEILVVLFIIGIVSGVTLLTISHSHHKTVEVFANQLTQTLTLAEEQAMLQPAVLGVSIHNNLLQFSMLKTIANRVTWVPLTDKAFQPVTPNNLAISFHSAAEKENSPQVIISTNGDLTPFTLYVGIKGEKPRYKITGDANGKVTANALS